MKKYSGHILIVDDDDDILLTARMVLKRHFTHVQTVNDPHKLVELLEDKAYNVVLLDMNFTLGDNSGRDGFEWLAYLQIH